MDRGGINIDSLRAQDIDAVQFFIAKKRGHIDKKERIEYQSKSDDDGNEKESHGVVHHHHEQHKKVNSGLTKM